MNFKPVDDLIGAQLGQVGDFFHRQQRGLVVDRGEHSQSKAEEP